MLKAEARATARPEVATLQDRRGNGYNRLWWVKDRPAPSFRIDPAVYGRFDKRKALTTSLGQYIGEDRARELARLQRENRKRRIEAGEVGYTLADWALLGAAGVVHSVAGSPNASNTGLKSWLPIAATSPEKLGVSKWQGSPQFAARLVRTAARHFGAATVGVAPLDRRHIYSYEADGKEIVFEPVGQPYEDEAKRVIPAACQFVVVLAIQMSRLTMKAAPTPTAAQTTGQTYSRLDYLVGATAEFIRGLGYVAIPSVNDIGSSIPFAIEAGLGDLGRMNRLVTPDFGPMVRLGKIITDLPLAAGKPVDFGLRDFCRRCLKCARACPPKALSFDPEPGFHVKGPWNNPGHEAWFEDAVKCRSYWLAGPGTNCGICFAVCPFTKPRGVLHSAVKATIAATPAFNSFFIKMDDVAGYGKRADAAGWWELDLPEYGIDG